MTVAKRNTRFEPVIREAFIEGRALPHDKQAEISALGSVLLDEDTWPIVGGLHQDAFYFERNRLIYRAMHVVAGEYGPKKINLVTVQSVLRDMQALDNAGGLTYLMALSDNTPTAAYAETYATIIREKHISRRAITESLNIVRRIYDQQESLEEILASMANLTSLAEQGRSRMLNGAEVDQEAIDTAERWMSGGNNDAQPSGFHDLDDQIVGFEKGSLNVVAARPSMGKTAFALSVAHTIANRRTGRVLIASLEMRAQLLALRQLANLGRVNHEKIRKGQLKGPDLERLRAVAAKRADMQLGYIDRPDLTVAQLHQEVRMWANVGPLSALVVDYLQLLEVPGVEDERQKVTRISRALKKIAMEFDIPVIALSQLSRAVEARQNKRPMLSDLRESGAIEQDADVVLFIYRDEYYNEKSDQPGMAEIIIGKQRNGPVGTVKLGYNAERVAFYSLAPEQPGLM
ncbi:replicative DNA helicase [Deinococcus peraridilitoris]|uniref:Replicative DNA helicase n=1 Tax=Deinococcus peraridilitoris (strain DSM 19664 / LMG 22246 / CIP 109416 / KR-200) TaxID=937777 RepID=L0A1U0_DEIPD|nr:replicative DNA helicase [Deinococcus peraridilitoris]AFZ67112.1 replicative DNA helicase [Deinococcus peraridilitoris DSM 19664]